MWPVAAGALAVIGALAVLLVLLPTAPIKSLLGGPYVMLDPTQRSRYYPDGVLISLAEGSEAARVRVRSIPREAFVADRAGRKWQAAHAALAGNLVPLSPIYIIETRGEGRITVEVSIAAGEEALTPIDLYAWDDRTGAWTFVPAALNASRQALVFRPQRTPISVMAVQVRPTTFAAGAVVSADTDDVGASYGLALLAGVVVDAAGNLNGTPVASQASTALPLVVNPSEGFTAYEDATASAVLIQRLVALASFYDGLALDFAPGAGYTGFVAALAEQLHDQGKRLDVVLRGTALTGVDPAALALAADRLWLAPGNHPADYLPGGAVERALDSLTDRVSRAQIGLLVSAYDVDAIGGLAFTTTIAEEAAHFGHVEAVAGYLDPNQPRVTMGSGLPLALSGSVEALGYDDALGMHYLIYRDEGGTQHHVYLATAQAVSRRLEWARRYALGAVGIEGLAEADNPAYLTDALSAFLGERPLGPPPLLQIVWQVRDESGVLLAEEAGDLSLRQYLWQAPHQAGRYTIGALLRGAGWEIALGEMVVEVVR